MRVEKRRRRAGRKRRLAAWRLRCDQRRRCWHCRTRLGKREGGSSQGAALDSCVVVLHAGFFVLVPVRARQREARCTAVAVMIVGRDVQAEGE